MRIEDQLSKDQKQKLNQIRKPDKQSKKRNRTPKKKEEKVDWIDIMGMNRDTYKRIGGAIRRK